MASNQNIENYFDKIIKQRFDVIHFLEEYERFPCLWKKSSADFKNRVKRDHAEETLQPLSGLSTIKELRQKIRSIRCTYNQEVAKVKKSMGTGTGADNVYKPKLIWFSVADSFLRHNLEENDSESNLDDQLMDALSVLNFVDESTPLTKISHKIQ